MKQLVIAAALVVTAIAVQPVLADDAGAATTCTSSALQTHALTSIPAVDREARFLTFDDAFKTGGCAINQATSFMTYVKANTDNKTAKSVLVDLLAYLGSDEANKKVVDALTDANQDLLALVDDIQPAGGPEGGKPGDDGNNDETNNDTGENPGRDGGNVIEKTKQVSGNKPPLS